ncbi:MAG TPA: DNA phosphorothioation system sulfurtransferase DndC [Pirellulales bacterium]|nr:DNA phosphorothioation system sulfurtransferase DndC [Pirellulales bacterium]
MREPAAAAKQNDSAFAQQGMATTVHAICDEIRELYLCDQVPWVVGYSGGKDSSAVLQLVWMAIRDLPPERRAKTVHVISTDTLVEQPVVAAWVDASHAKMRAAAAEQQVPVVPHKLSPDVKDSFWVNLIGRGYPAPRKLFRWCTARMKIAPSNKFIRDVVRENGEAILVLGTRRAESQKRAIVMDNRAKGRLRERLSPNANLPNSLVYSPIEDWKNDDVWLYLMQVKNPWGHTNKSLLGMYQGASADGECPLVVDTSTPSCGTSRFGCWVCTVVDKDRSMEAMIKNDEEKVWMTPLLELRNELGEPDRHRRDYRRMDGRVQLFHDSTVPGPYTKKWREIWLRRVLEVQRDVRALGPPEVRTLELISKDELAEIRRLWLYEKHEFDDALPRVYREVTGEDFPTAPADDKLLGGDDWRILREVCGDDEAFFEIQADLLDVERQYRAMTRRAGVYTALEDCLRVGQYGGEEEAIAIRNEQERRKREAEGRNGAGPRPQQPSADEAAAENETGGEPADPQGTLFTDQEPIV